MPEQINGDMEQWGKLAAENFTPEVQAPSWEKIEKVLQREMPEEKDKRRRALIWFFLLAGLLTGGYFLIRGTGNVKTAPANTAITKTNGQHSAGSNTQGITTIPQSSKKETPQGAASIAGASPATTNKAVVASTQSLPVVKQPVAVVAKPANNTTATAHHTGGWTEYPPLSASGSSSKNKNVAGKGKPVAKDNAGGEAFTVTMTPGNDHNDKRIEAVEDKDKYTDKTTTKPGNVDAQQPGTTIPGNAAVIQKEEAAKGNTDTIASLVKQPDTAIAKSKTIIVPNQPVDSIAKKDEKKKDKVSIPGPLEFTALYGSDISTVRFTNGDKPGNSLGLLVGYHLSSNWSIRTGAIWTRKIYTVQGSDFKVKTSTGPYPTTLTSVSGFCDMWDLPLDVKYDFHPDHKWHLFAEGGLSTYLMSKESYDYEWVNSIGTMSYSHSTLNTQRNYLFSIVNLSVGLSTMLNKRVSLQLQPYAKIPLAGVGAGEIHLMSFGMYATVSLRPFNKKAKK